MVNCRHVWLITSSNFSLIPFTIGWACFGRKKSNIVVDGTEQARHVIVAESYKRKYDKWNGTVTVGLSKFISIQRNVKEKKNCNLHFT